MNRAILLFLSMCGFLASASAQTATDPNEGLTLTHNPASGVYTLAWWGISGRTYFIQQSDDLLTWTYFPLIEAGDDDVLAWGFTSTADKFFLKLKFTDDPTDDPDGDGMNSDWELRAGYDPLVWNDPSLDPDDDDADNETESIANTSPTDPAPVLTLSSPAGASLVP